MADHDDPQRERLKRAAGHEPSYGASGHRTAADDHTGTSVGKRALTDGWGIGAHTAASVTGVGKATLAGSWGQEVAIGADAPAYHAAIDASHQQLEALRAANAATDHDASIEAAHQLRVALDRARAAATEAEQVTVDELEAAAAPLLAAAFVPSRAAIDETFYGLGRAVWDKEVATWRTARARAWQGLATPFAAQLGIAATIMVDDTPAAHGARGLAHGGVVHLAQALAPEHGDALHVLAHELVHVAQAQLPIAGDLADAEREADELAAALVRGALPHRPRIGLPAGVAAADTGTKSAPAAAAPPYEIDVPRLHITVRRSWLAKEPGFEETGRAPVKTLELLHALQRAGGIPWATEASLARLAAIPHETTLDRIELAITRQSYEIIGIPPLSSAMVAPHGDGLEVIFRVAGIPVGHDVPLASADIEQLLQAISTYTGEPVRDAARAMLHGTTLRTDRGAGVASTVFDGAGMRDLLGQAAWARARARETHRTGGAAPISVAGELTADEHARITIWLATHVPGGAASAPDRALLVEIDAIDHDEHYREAIRAYLRTGVVPSPIDSFSLHAGAVAARYAADRLELGVSMPGSIAPPGGLTDAQLPAQLTQHAGLVLDGDAVTFEVVIDFHSLTLMPGAYEAFAKKAWHADVEWVFVRPELPASRTSHTTHHDGGSIVTTETLKLQAKETQAVWDVHAFVRTSHFLPTHVKTAVQVKTIAKRMGDLRAAALGDADLASTMSPDADGDMVGKAAFQPMTVAQRAAKRNRERMTNELAAEYLEEQRAPGYADAIAELRERNNAMRAEEDAVKAKEAAGWTTFDVRATYLSETDPVPSGTLDVFGSLYAKDGALGHRDFFIELHDRTRLVAQEDYTFSGSGPTFSSALEHAFEKLAAEYPKGRAALFAAARDTSGAHEIGQTIGFERKTFSTWAWTRQYVFHPLAQAALAGATVLALICAPEAAIPLMISIGYAAATSVDDLVHRANNGTLDVTSASIDLLNLGMSVLPFASTARPIAETEGELFEMSRAAVAVKLLGGGAGQLLVMGLQTKQALAALQAQDVGAIGKMYAELLELQKTTHPSDPRLAQLRAQIEERATEARMRLYDACTESFGQGGLLLVHGLMVEALVAGGHGGSAAGRHGEGGEPVGTHTFVHEQLPSERSPATTGSAPEHATATTPSDAPPADLAPREANAPGEAPAARPPAGLARAADLATEPELLAAAPGRSKETTAAAVPGSSFQGRARALPDLAAEKRAAAEVKAAGQHAMESAAKLVPEIVGAPEKVSSAHVEGNSASAEEERARLDDTYLVRLADPPPLTVRVTSGPVAGNVVARTTVNASKAGSNRVGNAGASVEIKGRYVIALSDAMDPVHARRAIAHELAEIVDERKLARANQTAPADALTATSVEGAALSPHDYGRIAELRDLADQLRAGAPGAEREMLALVEHLGLRGGPDAARRRAMIEPHLDSAARGVLDRFVAQALEPTLRAHLDDVRAQAAHEAEAGGGATPAALAPRFDAAPGTIIDAAHAAQLANRAMEARAKKSAASLANLYQRAAGLPRGEYPKIGDLQIGGGAGLAARDPSALLVDKRGRWQADPSERIAQTAAQLRGLVDAGIGDPFQFARPDERVPMSAIKLWEDTIAARGPLIDGEVVAVKVEASGRTLVEIAPLMGGAKLTLEVTGRIVTSPGFPPERIPGTPKEMTPEKAIGEIKDQLAKLVAEPSTAPAVKAEAEAALAEIAPLAALETRPGARESDLSTVRKAIDRRGLSGLMATEAGPAYKMAVAGDAWKTLQLEHPGKVLLGDAANLASIQPMATDRWVIGGPGGTSISAAEILLKGNPKAHVTIAGKSPPPGLIDNTQFQEILKAHADEQTVRAIERLTGTKLAPGDGRFSLVLGVDVGTPVESGGDIRIDSPTPAGYAGGPDPLAGGGYISGIGREGQLPPVVAEMIADAEKNGLDPGLELMFDDDRQYLGYRVTLTRHGQVVRSVDVTGAASRYVPWELAPKARKAAMQERVSVASDLDAPPESGNFDGGFVASATQASRYAVARKTGGSP